MNLAVAMAARGLSVGVVDADIYGHSIPRMLGADGKPTQVEKMIMPPQAHGVKVISIGMFTPGNTPVVWRGPMLHRALQQFLADVFWGDLDVLLLDLPPGTGDIAISVAQLVPNAEILVVTTPQQAAAEVAERAGSIALQTRQRVAGVIENMSWLEMPDGSRMDVFGSGGGAGRRRVADQDHRRRRAAAGPGPAGPAPAGARRRGHADRAVGPGLGRGSGAERDREEALGPLPRPGRPPAERLPRRATPLPQRDPAVARCNDSFPAGRFRSGSGRRRGSYGGTLAGERAGAVSAARRRSGGVG